MILLLSYLGLALFVSFLCSILEAVILSITPGYIAVLERTSPGAGATLRHFKSDIEKPLAAILSLNTIAHTVGAAGVGAQAVVVFGGEYTAIISAVLTLLILVLSEIIPKTLGARYWRGLAGFTARVLPALILSMYPLVLMSQKIAGWLSRGSRRPVVNLEELRALTDLAKAEGVVGDWEPRILQSLFMAGRLKVGDIMTPRTVMFTLPAGMKVREAMETHSQVKFSRIPIHEGSQEDIRAMVFRVDILLEASRGQTDTELRALGQPLASVPETASLMIVFEQFLKQRQHMALVVDEYGGITGLVTLEDVLETLLGVEIVDETDQTIDMQEMARRRWAQRARAMGLIPPEEADGNAG